MTRRSLKGWISAAPVSRTTLSAAASRALCVGSQSTTVPPRRSTDASLTRLTVRGITTNAGIPLIPAAHASAAPWLPDEWVATPRAASASASERTAFIAPRALKDPVFWKFSHLKKRRAPDSASRRVLVSTGVRWTRPRMRASAARMSSSAISLTAQRPLLRRHERLRLVDLDQRDAGRAIGPRHLGGVGPGLKGEQERAVRASRGQGKGPDRRGDR